MLDSSVPPCMPLVPLKLLPQCCSSDGMTLSKFVCGYLRGTAWGSRSFFHWINPCSCLQPEVRGLIFLALVPSAGSPAVELGLPTPELSLPNCYPPHVYLGPLYSTSLSLLPVWMDVVSLIPPSYFHSTWFLLFLSNSCSIILVVILMWFYEEVSHFYLCHCLDWKLQRSI